MRAFPCVFFLAAMIRLPLFAQPSTKMSPPQLISLTPLDLHGSAGRLKLVVGADNRPINADLLAVEWSLGTQSWRGCDAGVKEQAAYNGGSIHFFSLPSDYKVNKTDLTYVILTGVDNYMRQPFFVRVAWAETRRWSRNWGVD